MKFKPMLAATCNDIEALRYPVLATPKIDGIRCLIRNGIPLSRSLKPIPNLWINSQLSEWDGLDLDGELVIGSFQQTQSIVMSHSGQSDFKYMVFDIVDESQTQSYEARAQRLKSIVTVPEWFKKVLPHTIRNVDELRLYENARLAEGHEGIMIRTHNSPYKLGRSTLNQQWLVKIKRFKDAEAIITGFEEKMHNANPAFENEVGHTVHTSHKDNMVPMDTLGALIVQGIEAPFTGMQFKIGSGFSDRARDKIWRCRDLVLNRVIKYKYQPHGVKEKPRIPIFLGFRHKEDMS